MLLIKYTEALFLMEKGFFVIDNIELLPFCKFYFTDDLQVYFNPYAEVPFDQNFPWPAEIALNYFDTETAAHIQAHPDGALVSRQIYAPDPASLFTLLRSYGFV